MKYLVILTLLFLCSNYLSAQTAAAPSLGDGSPSNPYQITSLENLYWIAAPDSIVPSPARSVRWTKSYVQIANIDALPTSTWFPDGTGNYSGWIPIGNSQTVFSGSYDGMGHTISGINLRRNSNYVGFIGQNYAGSISNLGLLNLYITGLDNVGGLLGACGSTVNNCYTTGTVKGYHSVGGLVAQNGKTISNSFSTCTVYCSSGGAFVGTTSSFTINNCYSRGNLIIYSAYELSSAKGGFIGFNSSAINYCYSTGSLTYDDNLHPFTDKGFVGSVGVGTFKNNFWDTQTSLQSSTGGTAGQYATGKLTTEMKTKSTFLSAGWDTTIWNMNPAINDGYPYLKWQIPGENSIPIKLYAFTFSPSGNNISLNWTTQTEKNSDAFIIERRTYYSDWTSVGFVKAAVISNLYKNYSFTDNNLQLGVYQYRLKMINNDATFLYSKTIIVDISAPSYSQTFLEADSTGDAYAKILSKGFTYEVPDCEHNVRHISEVWDSYLKKFVFVFDVHRDLDNDQCINFANQRTEIKSWDQSPNNMTAYFGDTLYTRWKFKLDSLFQSSPDFCHIHQIKAGDGPNVDVPLNTLTPLIWNSGGDYMTVVFTSHKNSSSVASNLLSAFRGKWVEAYEKTNFNNGGGYDLLIKSVDDESVVLSYGHGTIMWTDSATFMGAKWGIFRSLNSLSYLRDESVRFADFSVVKGGLIHLPDAPTELRISSLSPEKINLTWKNNSVNVDQFRIDRSSDGIVWSYLASAKVGNNQYTDSLIVGGTYFYKIRAENTIGNSIWSDSIGGNYPLPVELNLFTAFSIERNIRLDWKTETEKNSNKFVIERKTNNTDWISIGSVKASVLSNSPKQYSYTDNKLQSGKYQYRLKMIDNDGTFEYSKIVEALIAVPDIYELSQNYPNPFNPNTVISYSIPLPSNVKLIVYNTLGQTINTLESGYKQPGNYSINFNASDLPSGIYFYKLEAGSFSQIKKMILLK